MREACKFVKYYKNYQKYSKFERLLLFFSYSLKKNGASLIFPKTDVGPIVNGRDVPRQFRLGGGRLGKSDELYFLTNFVSLLSKNAQ